MGFVRSPDMASVRWNICADEGSCCTLHILGKFFLCMGRRLDSACPLFRSGVLVALVLFSLVSKAAPHLDLEQCNTGTQGLRLEL